MMDDEKYDSTSDSELSTVGSPNLQQHMCELNTIHGLIGANRFCRNERGGSLDEVESL